ncbi:MAG: hypothetical protein V3T88_01680 [Nitrosomonadaceae bacterium]
MIKEKYRTIVINNGSDYIVPGGGGPLNSNDFDATFILECKVKLVQVLENTNATYNKRDYVINITEITKITKEA